MFRHFNKDIKNHNLCTEINERYDNGYRVYIITKVFIGL